MTRAELLAGTSLVVGKPLVICDTECYKNFWCIGFLRVSDGKVVVLEKSARKELDRGRLLSILLTHKVVTFNGQGYDYPIIFLAVDGATNARLKQATNQIIEGGLKYWEAEREFNIRIPREAEMIDLMEPQPNASAGLKILNGRLHGKKMQDLPYDPDHVLTEEEMDKTIAYMGNDLDATFNLLASLKEPLELRAALSKQYGVNFMSKSDAQMGEGIIRKRVEQVTGEKIEKPQFQGGTTFPFRPPEYLKFDTPELQSILDRLANTDFIVQHNGKVDLPPWLDGKTVRLGETDYAMGIGGLHSTESNRAVHADADHMLVDLDVASFYPRIIINSGLYPKAIGRVFIDVYRTIVDDRVDAKHKAADKSLADEIREMFKAMADGLKIAANGIFGKLGSIFSILFAPHLMIAVTLTGQLALLMLIERMEKAGISVVSGNTDGVVLRVPRDMIDKVDPKTTRVTGGLVKEIVEQWESDTGFTLEATEYLSIYNQSVNSYIAVKPGNTAKLKGPINNPWRSDGSWKPDLRQQLMKNPQMSIITNAVVDLILNGTPIEDTIRAGKDVRDFITVVKVDGGATWGEHDYLGKVVRYYWAREGREILRKKGHWKTGTRGKVSNTDSCRPMMELPDDFALPADLDYDRYISQAREVLMDIGYDRRPDPIRPLKIFKYNAIGWFAVAAA